jgi:hypothetical protein
MYFAEDQRDQQRWDEQRDDRRGDSIGEGQVPWLAGSREPTSSRVMALVG